MKKIVFLACVASLLINGVSGQIVQDTLPPHRVFTASDYITKYKRNKTIGRVLLASGIAMIVGGGLAFASYAGNGFNGAAPVSEEVLFLVVGPAAALTSIPFFISAKRYKTKAALVFNGQSLSLGNPSCSTIGYPALALTIHL